MGKRRHGHRRYGQHHQRQRRWNHRGYRNRRTPSSVRTAKKVGRRMARAGWKGAQYIAGRAIGAAFFGSMRFARWFSKPWD